MRLVPLEFHGIHVMQPEEFLCAVLRWPEENRILPIWLSPIEGGRVAAREDGYAPRRPDTHDLLIEALESQGGLQSITITSHHEGVFVVEVVTAQDSELDARISDALVLSKHFDLPIEIDDELLQQVSIFVPEDALVENFQLSFATPESEADGSVSSENSSSESLVRDEQADADFEAMMRQLGVSEEDLLSGEATPEVNDTDVTKDDDGEDKG